MNRADPDANPQNRIALGLARCTWRGLNHFKAYVWSSVVAYNLVVFVRLRPS
jgi:transposase, IS5 family